MKTVNLSSGIIITNKAGSLACLPAWYHIGILKGCPTEFQMTGQAMAYALQQTPWLPTINVKKFASCY
jgi:hypothetical protein